MLTKSKNIQATEEAYLGFTQGNLEPLFKMTHPQKASWNYFGDSDVPFTGTFKGMEGVHEFFSHMPKVTIERFDIKSYEEKGDVIEVINDVRIVVNETGKVVEGLEKHILRFEGDKIVEQNIYPPGKY